MILDEDQAMVLVANQIKNIRQQQTDDASKGMLIFL